jgi:hypothetical protein
MKEGLHGTHFADDDDDDDDNVVITKLTATFTTGRCRLWLWWRKCVQSAGECLKTESLSVFCITKIILITFKIWQMVKTDYQNVSHLFLKQFQKLTLNRIISTFCVLKI